MHQLSKFAEFPLRLQVFVSLRCMAFRVSETVKSLYKNPIPPEQPTLKFLLSITSSLAG